MRYRVLLLPFIIIVLITLSFNIYLLASLHKTKSYYDKREGSYVRLLEQSIEIMLRDEVVITNQERMQRSKWISLFKEYGIVTRINNMESITIPLDNEQVIGLLSIGSKPYILEESEGTYQIVYDIGDKRIELAYSSGETMTKRVILLFKNPGFLASYTNFNNERFTPAASLQPSQK